MVLKNSYHDRSVSQRGTDWKLVARHLTPVQSDPPGLVNNSRLYQELERGNMFPPVRGNPDAFEEARAFWKRLAEQFSSLANDLKDLSAGSDPGGDLIRFTGKSADQFNYMKSEIENSIEALSRVCGDVAEVFGDYLNPGQDLSLPALLNREYDLYVAAKSHADKIADAKRTIKELLEIQSRCGSSHLTDGQRTEQLENAHAIVRGLYQRRGSGWNHAVSNEEDLRREIGNIRSWTNPEGYYKVFEMARALGAEEKRLEGSIASLLDRIDLGSLRDKGALEKAFGYVTGAAVAVLNEAYDLVEGLVTSLANLVELGIELTNNFLSGGELMSVWKDFLYELKDVLSAVSTIGGIALMFVSGGTLLTLVAWFAIANAVVGGALAATGVEASDGRTTSWANVGFDALSAMCVGASAMRGTAGFNPTVMENAKFMQHPLRWLAYKPIAEGTRLDRTANFLLGKSSSGGANFLYEVGKGFNRDFSLRRALAGSATEWFVGEEADILQGERAFPGFHLEAKYEWNFGDGSISRLEGQ